MGRCTRVQWESLQRNVSTFFRWVLKRRGYVAPPELLLHFRWHKAQQPRWFLPSKRAYVFQESCKEVLTLKKIDYLFRRRLFWPIRKINTSLYVNFAMCSWQYWRKDLWVELFATPHGKNTSDGLNGVQNVPLSQESYISQRTKTFWQPRSEYTFVYLTDKFARVTKLL